MSRAFWMVVGAVGGVAAYRKSVQAAARARELGALGTAQAAASATSRLAGRTAHGLGRLQDARARREGRLVVGSAVDVSDASASTATTVAVPAGWVPASGSPGPAARAAARETRAGAVAPPGTAPPTNLHAGAEPVTGGSAVPPTAAAHPTARSTSRTVRQRRD